MNTRELVRPWAATAVALLLLGLGGCKFEPDIASGALVCAADGRCPDGFFCSLSKVCCQPGDTSPDCSPDAGPPPSFTHLKVVEPVANMVALDDSCSHGVQPGPTDRWCAFTRGAGELWVVNVSESVRTRTTALCDGTSPHCLKLFDGIYRRPAGSTKNAFTRPGFDGELLLFYAQATHNDDADEDFRGTIYGWAPGFPAPRRLTGPAGEQCLGPPFGSAAVVLCRETGAAGTEIHGGVPGPQPLPLLHKVVPDESFSFQFSRAGDKLVYSIETGAMTPLYVQATADIGDMSKRTMIAPNVADWDLSYDGTLVYYLRAGGGPIAPLVMAEPTAGGRSTELSARVERFTLLTNGRGADVGVVAYEDVAGAVGTGKLFVDRAAPTKSLNLGRIAEALLSPDARYSFIKTMVQPGNTVFGDAKIVDNQGGASCTVQTATTTGRWRTSFSLSGRLALFSEYVSDAIETGWVAAANGCAKRKYTDDLHYLNAVGNDAILYVEGVMAMPENTNRLRYERLNPGTAAPIWPATTLHEGVASIALLEPDRKQVVYSGVGGMFVVDLP